MHSSSVSGKRFRPPRIRPRSKSLYRILPLLLLLPAAAFLRSDFQWWRRVNTDQAQIPIQDETATWLQFGSEQAASLYNTVINVAWEKNDGKDDSHLNNGERLEKPHIESHDRARSQAAQSSQHHEHDDEHDTKQTQSDNEDVAEGNDDINDSHNHLPPRGISGDRSGTVHDHHSEEDEGEEEEAKEDEEEQVHSEGDTEHANMVEPENNGSKTGADHHESGMNSSFLHTTQQDQMLIREGDGKSNENGHYRVPTAGARDYVSIELDGQSKKRTLDRNDNLEDHGKLPEYYELKGDTALEDTHAEQTQDTNVFDNSIYNRDSSQSSSRLDPSSLRASEDQHGNGASNTTQDRRYADHVSFAMDTQHEHNTQLPSEVLNNHVRNTDQSTVTNEKESRLSEELHTHTDSAPSSNAQQWSPFIQPRGNQNNILGKQQRFSDSPQALSRPVSHSSGQGQWDGVYLSSLKHAQEIRQSSWDAPYQPITDPEHNITTQDLRTAFRLLPINQTLVESGLLPLLTSYDIRNDTEFKELALHGNLTDMYVRYGSLLRRGHGSILGPPYNKPVDNIYHVRHSADPNKGYSMYASENIPDETILGSYGGELVLSSRLQHGQYAWEAPSMFLRTESGVWKEHATTLDSSRVGNLLRFVNDLGDDSYNLEAIWVPLQNRWTLFYKTTRPVLAGEEFSIYYGPDYWGGGDSSLHSRRRMAVARESVSPPVEISGAFIQSELRMRSKENGRAKSSKESGDGDPILTAIDTTRNPTSHNGAVLGTTIDHDERPRPATNDHLST